MGKYARMKVQINGFTTRELVNTKFTTSNERTTSLELRASEYR